MNKKILVQLVALCISITPSLFAALAVYDGFTYSENSDLDGQNGGFGWDGAWQGSPARGSSVASPGLQYEDLITGMNSMRLSWPAESSLLPERELGVSRGSDGTTTWMTFLLNPHKIGPGFFVSMNRGSLMVGRGWANTKWSIRRDAQPVAMTDVDIVMDQTCFMVVRVDFNAGDDDVYFWINPPLTNEPSTASATTLTLTSFTFNSLVIRGYGVQDMDVEFDEIRVGDTWDDVAPRITDPPAAPANVQASDGIYNSRVLVTWDPADTATKYLVYRSPTAQTSTAVAVSAEIAGISFSDTNAVTGVTNYYFVQAGNSIGWSDLGSGDPGFRGSGSAVDIAGFINDPNSTYGTGVDYNLYGDTTFGTAAGTIAGDIYFSVYGLTLEPAAALQTSLDGSLSGSGDLVVNGQDGASISRLGGSQPNTRSGETIVNGGVLSLAKPSGETALAGDITLDGNSQPAILQLDTTHQIADTVRLTISGKTGGWLRTGGFSETLGALDIQAQALIELGPMTGDLHFADCSSEYWNPNVNAVIWHWHANSRVFFGTTASGLTSGQRDMILFKDPAGHDPGMYSAALQSDGELVPDALIPPAFDESPAAQAAREAMYSKPGLDLLSGVATPLESGMVINFFGDSITWLDNANSYVNKVKSSLAAGPGSSGLGITVNRRGINGGTAADILNGKSGVQDPFATLLSQDQPDIVVMFIGINDIWWAGTSAAAYESTMREIVARAQATGVIHFVMATPWLRNEKPDGSNINDAKIVQFAGICSNIAADTGVVFVDLHQLGMMYLQNNNNAHLFNFIPDYKNSGILTYDGVHPNATGAEFLANQLSYGIVQSMGVPEPSVLLPVGAGMLMLIHRRVAVIGNQEKKTDRSD